MFFKLCQAAFYYSDLIEVIKGERLPNNQEIKELQEVYNLYLEEGLS